MKERNVNDLSYDDMMELANPGITYDNDYIDEVMDRMRDEMIEINKKRDRKKRLEREQVLNEEKWLMLLDVADYQLITLNIK